VTSPIQHTVVFSLRHSSGSSAEADFLAAALALATIPGVGRFEQLRQVSPKSDFAFCFSMYFAGEDAYQAYDDHPTHIAFVRDRWDPEVSDFQEFDFVPFTAAD
jgi:Stress responsive A/B Barrel Domain